MPCSSTNQHGQRTSKPTVRSIIDSIASLPPRQLSTLLAQLAALVNVRAAGWRIKRKQQRRERDPALNAMIRFLHSQGQTYGQIAMKFGISRYAVAGVCARGKKCVA